MTLGRRLVWLLPAAFELILTGSLLAQKLESKGEAWLAERSEPAEINVNGSWHGGSWGTLTLSQAQGSREVTGRGDEWDIIGVVSGKKVCLLFHHRGKIGYSAELSPDGPNGLDGHYVEGFLTPGVKLRLMHLSR
jgi:hypothetical protein